MAIIEIYGGPVTHRYLMGKSKDELARMHMHLLRELSARDWQPIETAPKDGTHVLTYSPQRTDFTQHIMLNWFANGSWRKCNSGCPPTHWQPIPAPPVAGGGKS